jgi:hypothetical protein
MPTCPAGHSSGADDYCDTCGARMAGPPPVTSPAAPTSPASAGAEGTGEPCPECGTQRTGRFCEDCGYDFAVGAGQPTPVTGPMRLVQPATTTSSDITEAPRDVTAPSGGTAPGPTLEAPAGEVPGWTAVVTADRDYYETVLRQGGGTGPDAGAFTFPPYCPERRIPLTGQHVRIGRRSVSQGTVPEIDLGEPPEDPGASHTHAVLLAKQDGTWTLVDPGSTNGTTINHGNEPIAVNVEVPMSDGDRIHVGVWTTITLRRG